MKKIQPIYNLKGKHNCDLQLSLLAAVMAAITLFSNTAQAAIFQWGQTNVNSIGNWSDASPSKWVGGGNPGTADSVVIDHQSPGPWTNVVDVSATASIQDLAYQGIGDEGGTSASGVNTTIAAGDTLSVFGANGFSVSTPVALNVRPVYNFFGNTMVVSNPAANFIVNGTMSSANNTKYVSLDMSGLTNLFVTVNQVGIADFMLLGTSVPTIGGSQTKFFLARNNVIKAGYSSDYSQLDFTNSIEFNRQSTNNTIANSLSANMAFNLGITNLFYADSIGVARGGANATGTPAPGSSCGYALLFKSTFANSVAPTALAYFRGPTTNRMSLLAIGVDSGTNTVGTSSSGKNRGMVDLRGGKVDMLVDQIWLGRNRTNSPATADDIGEFAFDNGTVNANTVIAGYMQYTNAVAICGGWLVVSTNGTLIINTNLELGHTAIGAGAESVNIAATYGQLWITNGGSVRVKQITVGQAGTNNVITLAPFSSLIVSNTIADSSKSLTTLNINGGSLTFSVAAGVTNVFVTNLNSTVTSTKINISSAPAGESTNVLIVYQAANQTPNVGIGTPPPGFNNMQLVVDTIAKTVSLIVSTNQPKNLAWRGGQNSQWDHASLNWLDTNTLIITHFTDGDKVTFDDTAAVPVNISITDTVNPSQSGTGIFVTNTVNSFVFNNSGGGSIGSCTLVKTGTNNLEIDCTASVGALVNSGSLTVALGGSIANATTATGTTLNNNGTISGGVICSGVLQNSGNIAGPMIIQTSANVSNSGTASGALSMQSGCSLNNSGSLTAIGSTTVATNAVLFNSGTIYGSSLTVALGGTLTDIVPGSAGVSAGSINVGTLSVFGTFNPGGTGQVIGTTKVTDYDYATSGQLGSPNGRVQLNAGSVTIFKFNSTNAQPYTKLLSQSQVYGPSAASKAINGCTLVISNVGPTAITAGDTFKLFGSYYTDGNPGNAGLNTTNSYPLLVPPTPGAGLAWDLSQLYASGTIGVISASSVQIMLTNNITIVGGSNIVTELSWPADFAGSGWLQQQINTLTNGLGTNWSNVGASDYVNDIILTNTVSGGASVFYRFVRP